MFSTMRSRVEVGATPLVRSTCTASCTGMPDFAAIDSPSRLTHVVVNAIRLFTSFMVLPSPSAPRCTNARTERFEHRLHAAPTASSSTADHEREHAVLCADRAAGERRLDEVVTGRRQARAELAHDLRAVGRQIDEDRARGRVAVHSSATARTTAGVGSDRTVTSLAAPDVAHRRHPRAQPSIDAARDRVDVVHDHVVTVGGEVGRHVSTDVARPMTPTCIWFPPIGAPAGARPAHRTPWRAQRGKR